ncbi:MAG TPA: ferrous iron transporter B, partial [Geobacteraceae bacterium]|nr:ferrous iron transporter B [Geobacteraceae bacterium]
METTIALAGNPNSGKTCLFNELTGARQHVGNYPGVTVEKKEGKYSRDGHTIHIVDLQGTYSLTAYSVEEVVARDFLVNERPGVVIDIVDASNLERNLYLTVQFLEMGIPLAIALNMGDVAQKRGIDIDTKKLSTLLGVPVIPTIARNGKGKDDLMKAATRIVEEDTPRVPLIVSYGDDIDSALLEMGETITTNAFLTERYPARWIALKYLERDEQILSKGREQDPAVSARLEEITARVSEHLRKTLNTYPEVIIADHRFGYINALVKQGVIKIRDNQERLYASDKIDKIVTNRFLGPIIMVGVLMGLYHFTFNYSEIPVGWFEGFFGWLGET